MLSTTAPPIIRCILCLALGFISTVGIMQGAVTTQGYQLKLVEPAGTPLGDFGTSVGVWRNLIFVGSPQFSTLAGAVHVYDASNGSLIRSLTPDPQTSASGFGQAIAVDDDYLLVGAWQEQAAYLFRLPSLEFIRKFVPNDTQIGRRFGWAVDLEGDRVVVGAYLGIANGIQSGTAYLFDLNSGQQLARLDPPAGKDDDRFGWAVDLTGPWASIGAWGEDSSPQVTFTGAVYTYRADSGSFAYRIPPGPYPSTSFGISVAGSGGRIIIGASRDDTSAIDGGAIHLGATGHEGPLQRIVPGDASVAFFGRFIAAFGSRALVSADFTRVNGVAAAGSAFLVDLIDGTILTSYRLEDPQPYDRFGTAVALSDRLAVIASPKSDFRAQGLDAVYVFAIPPRLRAELDGPPLLNRITGLFEQRVTVSNISGTALRGFRLQVSGLPAGVTLQNRTTGNDAIDHSGTIPAAGFVSLVLEFHSPLRDPRILPVLSVSEFDPPQQTPTEPSGLAVNRTLRLQDGAFLIEFNATPGARYEIQYSDDQKTWRRSPVIIHAANNRVQWIDRGPPHTATAPAVTPSRFYTVRELAGP